MSETNEETRQEASYIASGQYEYCYHQRDGTVPMLQIFSRAEARSTYHDAQETLDLLRFLQSHQASIEEAARQQAAQKPRKKTTEERIGDLFH